MFNMNIPQPPRKEPSPVHLHKLFTLIQALPADLIRAAADEANERYEKAGQHEQLTRDLETHRERLARAMDRERVIQDAYEAKQKELDAAKDEAQKLSSDNRDLSEEVTRLREQIESMNAHPEVRAARAERLKAQREEIDKQIQALTPPPSPYETKDEYAARVADTDRPRPEAKPEEPRQE